LKHPIRPVGIRDNQVLGTLIKKTEMQWEYKVPETHFNRYSGYASRLRKLRKQHPGINFYGVKIIWTDKTHSPGFIQWTIRPYVQGMGCDGTSDGPIHLIAKTYVARKGGDYRALYKQAYEKETGLWINSLEKEHGAETIVPKEIDPSIMLSDLYDINNRSLVTVLSDKYGIDFT
jgi:hypothetical protein